MAKIHPQAHNSSDVPCYLTSRRETFTIWMKSLILNGNGCTVFDANGQVVYRVDNYNSKCSNEVQLMDLKGDVVCTILRKRVKLFLGTWEGYRSIDAEIGKVRKPDFQVRKAFSTLRGEASASKVIVGSDRDQSYECMIESWSKGSSGFKIIDKTGKVIAEVKRKESRSGVALGKDVLTMVVEACVDHSLIMGLVIVNGLISSKM
ncbi:hypothetical protein K2173_009700 [Erythroxylum novogranatense]|uniref:Uncharacterized protein n=1 Tax=Erythroxylum novogranatense TaxID=1862640 RepID=A0AAV8U852_9ROSI|nr:hypothetical protein K2173_009700 [Erythroxylum novogranatense]